MEKKKFNFYKSYWDSFNMLENPSDKVELIEIISKVQFLEVHIEDIEPTSYELKLLFSSIKHSLFTSVKGFCDKTGFDYESIRNTDPCQGGSQGGSDGGSKGPCQQLVKNNKKRTTNNKQQTNKKEIEDKFETWWESYKKKGNRKTALKRWFNLTDKQQNKCLMVVEDYVKSRSDVKFQKDGESYLYQEVFDDVIINNKSFQSTSSAPKQRADLQPIVIPKEYQV